MTRFGTVLDEVTSRYRTLLENPGDETGTDVGGASPQTTPRRPRTLPGLTAHDARANVYDTDQTLVKTLRAQSELADTLACGTTRRDRSAVLAHIARNTHPRWINWILTTILTGQIPADLRLTWHIDPATRKTLETELFGKRLLVTDHDDWTIPEVIVGCRSHKDVESGSLELKDPHVVGFSPMFHWTDSKIRVQLLCCVLALAVAHLMRREAHHAGPDLSVRELLRILRGIEETLLLYPTGKRGRPRAQRILTDQDPAQQRLFEPFNLETSPDADMGSTSNQPRTPVDLHVYNPSPR